MKYRATIQAGITRQVSGLGKQPSASQALKKSGAEQLDPGLLLSARCLHVYTFAEILLECLDTQIGPCNCRTSDV